MYIVPETFTEARDKNLDTFYESQYPSVINNIVDIPTIITI